MKQTVMSKKPRTKARLYRYDELNEWYVRMSPIAEEKIARSIFKETLSMVRDCLFNEDNWDRADLCEGAYQYQKVCRKVIWEAIRKLERP